MFSGEKEIYDKLLEIERKFASILTIGGIVILVLFAIIAFLISGCDHNSMVTTNVIESKVIDKEIDKELNMNKFEVKEFYIPENVEEEKISNLPAEDVSVDSIARIKSQIGKPYVLGSDRSTTHSFDCSELMYYALKNKTFVGLNTVDMLKLNYLIRIKNFKDRRPGDIIFKRYNRSNHVVMVAEDINFKYQASGTWRKVTKNRLKYQKGYKIYRVPNIGVYWGGVNKNITKKEFTKYMLWVKKNEFLDFKKEVVRDDVINELYSLFGEDISWVIIDSILRGVELEGMYQIADNEITAMGIYRKIYSELNYVSKHRHGKFRSNKYNIEIDTDKTSGMIEELLIKIIVKLR